LSQHIYLADFVSNYKKNGEHISKRKKPNVIQFVKYNKHIDYENFCRENIFIYVPFEESEDTLKHGFATWEVAYAFYQNAIQTSEAKFTYNINPTWGDLETTLEQLDSLANNDDRCVELKTTRPGYEHYDLQAYLQCPQQSNMEKSINLGFQVTKHPFVLENKEYYRIRRFLNK
jgi:hypothetical protein